MKKILSFLIAIWLTASLAGTAFAEQSFTDVREKDWFYSAVIESAERGIMQGVSEGRFKPNDSLTRVQLITVLARLSEDDITGKGSLLKFTDVPKNAWYADYLGWGVGCGIAGGYPDGTFKPNAPVLRQELAAFVVRYLNYKEIDLPDAPLTDKFADEKKIPSWASEDIEALRLTGLMGGDAKGNFSPKSKTTRAQFATVVVRYFASLENARDVMHSRLTHLPDYFEKQGKLVKLEAGMSKLVTNEYFNSYILPKLGLDPETYELTIPEEQLEAVLDSGYANLLYGDSALAMLTITIKNKVTGEETEPYTARYMIVKTDIPIYVDPDDFDPGIDPAVYDQMKKLAELSFGDLGRLAKAIGKARGGEDITVAFIGGSITEGAGASSYECYAKIIHYWFEKRFPDITVNYVNAGIGGTPSELGNIRLGDDILSHDPDIIFVEFSVNDESTPKYQESYECLVRSALMSENEPAVIMLFSSGGVDSRACQDLHSPIGYYYGIPMVSIADAMIYCFGEHVIEWEHFSADTIHPNIWGYQVYSDMIENFLYDAIAKIDAAEPGDLTVKPVPEETLTEARFVGLDLVTSGDSRITADGWNEGSAKSRMSDGWTYSGKGGSLTLKAEFGHCYICYGSTVDPSYIEYSIDGGEPVHLETYGQTLRWTDIPGLTAGEHTLVITGSGVGVMIPGIAIN